VHIDHVLILEKLDVLKAFFIVKHCGRGGGGASGVLTSEYNKNINRESATPVEH
jgi:hypothetical protein